MDGSGKDGVVCIVFWECNFSGFGVYFFKKLMDEEFVYDFFWCVYK